MNLFQGYPIMSTPEKCLHPSETTVKAKKLFKYDTNETELYSTIYQQHTILPIEAQQTLKLRSYKHLQNRLKINKTCQTKIQRIKQSARSLKRPNCINLTLVDYTQNEYLFKLERSQETIMAFQYCFNAKILERICLNKKYTCLGTYSSFSGHSHVYSNYLDLKGQNSSLLMRRLGTQQKFTLLDTLCVNFNVANATLGNLSLIQLTGVLTLSATLRIIKLKFNEKTCKISDDGIKCLGTNLKVLSNLRCIEFLWKNASNSFTNKGLDLLSNGISSMKRLESLSIAMSGGSNKITENGVCNLVDVISKISDFRDLQLDFSGGSNQITDKCLKYIGKVFVRQTITNLRLEFSFGLNSISDKGLRGFCKYTKEWQMLDDIYLDLRNNDQVFDEESVQKFYNLDCQGEKVLEY